MEQDQDALVHLFLTNALTHSFSQEETNVVRTELLGWYDQHRRHLPWRGDKLKGHPLISPSGYGTWISEVMLQQTRVETVIAYWFRWMERFPTVQALAAASAEEVNVLWAGLGYYRRAAQILACARQLVAECGGDLPRSTDELKRLPGIGPYTAGAISSIAFGRVTGLVDGNVSRVLSRLRAISAELGPGLDKVCWPLMDALVDPARPGHFNQAVMELGATVCTPTSPRCGDCPLQGVCHVRLLTLHSSSHSSSLSSSHPPSSSSSSSSSGKDIDMEDLARPPLPRSVTDFPKRAPKKAPKEFMYAVSVLKMRGPPPDTTDPNDQSGPDKYLFVRRPPRGLLENQWEFPSAPVPADAMSSDSCDSDSLSGSDKTNLLLPICQSHLRNELGVCVNAEEGGGGGSGSASSLGRLMLHAEEMTVRPHPIVHVFSHQRHTMYIMEASFDPCFCVAPQGDVGGDEGVLGAGAGAGAGGGWYSRLLAPRRTSEASGAREVEWMTLQQLQQRGVTTGVQKIIAMIATPKTAPAGAKAGRAISGKDSSRKKKSRGALEKSNSDNGKIEMEQKNEVHSSGAGASGAGASGAGASGAGASGAEEDENMPRKRKITQFFKPK